MEPCKQVERIHAIEKEAQGLRNELEGKLEYRVSQLEKTHAEIIVRMERISEKLMRASGAVGLLFLLSPVIGVLLQWWLDKTMNP